jgi:toxin FitB
MFLVDTNVLSELPRPRPALQVERWLRSIPSASLFISVLTIGELKRGVLSLNRRAPQRASALQAWIDDLRRDFERRILPVDDDVADAWAVLSAVRPLPAIDGLLMATALSRNLTLVTRDTRHPRALGVPVLDPWSA